MTTDSTKTKQRLPDLPGDVGSDDNRRVAAELAYGVISLLTALFLLFQIPAQTKWLSGQPFTKQPGLWAIISIGGMTFFGAVWLIGKWRKRGAATISDATQEFLHWLRALEFVGWFMSYVWLVPRLGYLPVTLLFCLLLGWRLGYRSGRSLAAAAGTGFAIVFVFKTLLSVKIPGGAIYELLPAAMRNFMISYF